MQTVDASLSLAVCTKITQVAAAGLRLIFANTMCAAGHVRCSAEVPTQRLCRQCRYNLRVVECRLAAMVLAVALGKPASDAVKITTLKEVEPLIIDKFGPGAEAQDKAVKEYLKEGVYMPEEVCTGAPA